MTIDRIDVLLNDAEINYICDLFLSNLGFDRSSAHYRYFRNAVLLSSRGIFKPAEMYTRLAECAAVERSEYIRHLKAALAELSVPIHKAYNSAYVEDDGNNSPIMRESNLDNTLLFLGTVFLYSIVSYYPKYGYISFKNPTE